MLDEMNQKLCLKRKKVINRGKRNRSVRSVLSILVWYGKEADSATGM